MSIYKEMRERIIQIKNERTLWKKRYDDIENIFKESCEKATEEISRMQSVLNTMQSSFDFLTKRISEHSREIDSLKEKTRILNLDVHHIKNYTQSTRSMLIELKKSIELQIEEMKRISDAIKEDMVSLKSQKHDMQSLQKDIYSHINEVIQMHEKVFDRANTQRITVLEKTLKEREREILKLNEEIKRLKKDASQQRDSSDELRADMKKFKEYVISYINDLLETYENRFSLLKKDIEHDLQRIRK